MADPAPTPSLGGVLDRGGRLLRQPRVLGRPDPALRHLPAARPLLHADDHRGVRGLRGRRDRQPVPRRARLGLGGTAPGAGARPRRQRAERAAVHRLSEPAGPHHRAGRLRRVDRAHDRDRDRVPGRTAPGRGRVAHGPAPAGGGDGGQPRRHRGRAARRRAARPVRAVAAGGPLRDLRRGAGGAGAADRLRAGDGQPAGAAAGLAAAAGGDTRARPRYLLRRHGGRRGGVRGLRRVQLPHARLPGRHHARDLVRGRGRRRLLRVRGRGGRADRARLGEHRHHAEGVGAGARSRAWRCSPSGCGCRACPCS